MAFITRGRIVAREESVSAKPLFAAGRASSGKSATRILPGPLVDAHLAARDVTERARGQAKVEARAQLEAELSAKFLALHAREERRAELDIDRTVKLAVLLAERLLGTELETRPERIAEMAQAALREARGARRAVIEAAPLDAEALRTNLSQLEFPPECLEVRSNADLSRGSLSIHTDIGTLDARLNPQLERLAAALHDALKR